MLKNSVVAGYISSGLIRNEFYLLYCVLQTTLANDMVWHASVDMTRSAVRQELYTKVFLAYTISNKYEGMNVPYYT